MIVSYVSCYEIIVTTRDGEDLMLREYFVEGDRKLEDYDRYDDNEESICIHARMYKKY